MAMVVTDALLQVDGLSVGYRLGAGTVQAVSDVSFTLEAGQTLGLVGESGCGKTTVAFALMRVLPVGTRISGRVDFEGTDLLSLSDEGMRDVRWTGIGMVFQAAMNALNPVLRVGDQVAEPLITKLGLSKRAARERAEEMLDLVGLPRNRYRSYPHELSGGMKQRVVIAMSLVCRPRLLIADEPTTALDVVVQDQILGKIKDLQHELGFALLIISHDMAMIAETCDRVAVMYGGRMMELAPTAEIYARAGHPYTKALLGAHPTIYGPPKTLISLAGSPPNLVNPPPGCRFAPRCPRREAICDDVEPDLISLGALGVDHTARCHFAREIVQEQGRP